MNTLFEVGLELDDNAEYQLACVSNEEYSLIESSPAFINYVEGKLPPGGIAGQYLKKTSSQDYDAEWSDIIVPSYIHIQNSASAEWNITHNLNKLPSVTVVDSAGSVVVGNVQYISETQIIITFCAPFSGKAILN